MNIKIDSFLYKFLNVYFKEFKSISLEQYNKHIPLSSCDIVLLFIKSLIMYILVITVLSLLSGLLFFGPIGNIIGYALAGGFFSDIGPPFYNEMTKAFAMIFEMEFVLVGMICIYLFYKFIVRKLTSLSNVIEIKEDSKLSILWKSFTSKICYKVNFYK